MKMNTQRCVKENIIEINWQNLPEEEHFLIGAHQYIRRGQQIIVFGNEREFPVPSGKLISARIGLVNTNPTKSTMPLPEGKVVVRSSYNGEEIRAGEKIQTSTVWVNTPNTGGVSNWAEIELCIELPSPSSSYTDGHGNCLVCGHYHEKNECAG